MRIFFNNTSLQPPRYPPFRYAFIVGFIVVGILLFTFNEDTFAQNDANAVYVRVVESETYFIHSYTSVGTRNFTPPAGVTQIEYLVVGGGGGGGGGNGDRGGGGAGGFVAGELTLTETALAVTVGDGGVGGFGVTIENAMGKPGENSSIGNTIIARVAAVAERQVPVETAVLMVMMPAMAVPDNQAASWDLPVFMREAVEVPGSIMAALAGLAAAEMGAVVPPEMVSMAK